MGAGDSKLEPKLLAEVRKHSKYSIGELQQWYGKFQEEYPKGYLTKSQFKDLYALFYPNGDAAEFAENNFRLFDINKDDKINFSEFMISLGVQCRGTTDEKINWMFKMFDINGDGVITRAEMVKIMRSMYKLLDTYDNTAELHVDKLYKKLDKNKDGKLSLDEFLKLGNTDQKLTDMLCGYGMDD